MFYRNGLACRLLNALVDDAEAPPCSLLVQRRRVRMLELTPTAELLQHLVLGGNIFVCHVARLISLDRRMRRGLFEGPGEGGESGSKQEAEAAGPGNTVTGMRWGDKV